MDEMANNKTGFNPIQTAEDWRERDVYCVPLRPHSKRPKNTDWTKLRLDGAKLRKAFKVGDNIGALWGEPSKHATDLDLDLEQACLVAPHILPETFIYGRRDKPRSHYVYRCPGAETKKWQIGRGSDIGTVVEIRSTGAQSVLPPSIHPDGDRYHIENDVEFFDISKGELERYGDEVAIAAIFTLFYPQSGSRHDYVHACTGTLCHAEWSEEKVRRVMAAVLSVIQLQDDELKDRLGSVVNTIEHYKIGDRVQGFRTLETWMEMPVITQLRRWCTSGAKIDRLLIPPPITLRAASEKDFDESWLKVDGLVGQVTAWASKNSYVQQPMFDLAVGIMCTAIASCNNYLVDGWDTPLQPYLMITAPTGDGKNAVLNAVQKFSHEIDLGDYVYRGFQSYYAMLDELSEPPNMACWLWDEAARHMANAKHAGSVDFQTLSHVISLYGQASEWVPGTPGRKQAIPPLEHPFLLVLATAQPDQLMDALTSAAEETGFTNRFVLIDSGETFPPRNRKRAKTFPSAIKKHARLIRDHEPMEGEFTRIKWADTKTWAMFDEFEEVSRRRTHRGERAWARANQNALILAGLAAVGIDPARPEITQKLARWALELVTWSTDRWADKIRLVGGETINEKESFHVEERIRHASKYGKSAQSKVHRDLIQKGFMPHSVLLRVCRKVQRHRLEQILDDLHDAEIIGSSEMDDNICYFAK